MISYFNPIIQTDLSSISESFGNLNEFDNKTVLITGANGHIAMYMAYTFIYCIKNKGLRCRLVLLSRNMEKLDSLYSQFEKEGYVDIVCGSVEEIKPIDADYVFHFAGNASPDAILNDPVGIMRANILGTFALSQMVIKNRKGRLVFASSREVYGEVLNKDLIDEENFGRLNTLNIRSCYPESKRASESILESYKTQYGLDFLIARIAHAYGPGMKSKNDGRVMQDLIGAAIEGKDIELKSDGSALRAFCYISDVVLALLYIAVKGFSGEAYNVSNEIEEISVLNLAKKICELKKGISIRFISNNVKNAYCSYKRIGLDTSKLESLGWFPVVSLDRGLYNIFKSNE